MTRGLRIARRPLILSSAWAALAWLQGTGKSGAAPGQQEPLRIFVVSDAHMGWTGADQPALAEQQACMRHLAERFADVDFFVDTGDAHHIRLPPQARHKARQEWSQVIANGVPARPFFYLPGNHELLDARSGDAETPTGHLGSLPCRPYYAIEHCGVRCVFLPQLLKVVLATGEVLRWVESVLASDPQRTTIIFAHNALAGTTFDNGEHDYRRLANSAQIREILRRYPGVRLWSHGHNHNFEVVRDSDLLCVSNGRIGGFRPPASWGDFGQQHLGGVEIEISRDGVRVRAYSATEQAYFDELGMPQMSAEMRFRTTLDRHAASVHWWGSGSLVRGTPLQHYSHQVGQDVQRIVTVRAVPGAALNEAPEMNLWATQPDWRGGGVTRPGRKRLAYMPGDVQTFGADWRPSAQGLWVTRLEGRKDPRAWLLVPGYRSRTQPYLRVARGQAYRLEVELGAGTARLAVVWALRDRLGKRWWTQRSTSQLAATDGGSAHFDLALPVQSSWQADRLDAGEGVLGLALRIEPHSPEVLLRRVRVRPLNGDQDGSPQLEFAVQSDAGNTAVDFERIAWRDGGAGDEVHVLMCAELGIEWQVRHAVAQSVGDEILISGPRNPWSPDGLVRIAPMAHLRQAYVAALQGSNSYRVRPAASEYALGYVGATQPEPAALDVWLANPQQLQSLVGGVRVAGDGSLLRVQVPAGSSLQFR